MDAINRVYQCCLENPSPCSHIIDPLIPDLHEIDITYQIYDISTIDKLLKIFFFLYRGLVNILNERNLIRDAFDNVNNILAFHGPHQAYQNLYNNLSSIQSIIDRLSSVVNANEAGMPASPWRPLCYALLFSTNQMDKLLDLHDKTIEYAMEILSIIQIHYRFNRFSAKVGKMHRKKKHMHMKSQLIIGGINQDIAYELASFVYPIT